MTEKNKIAEYHNVDREILQNNILPGYKPAVLRGFVSQWPAVQAAQQSPEGIARYLLKFDIGAATGCFVAHSDTQGRFFYNSDCQSFNFSRSKELIRTTLERLVVCLSHPSPPSIYMGSTSITESLPGFLQENVSWFFDKQTKPNIWIGNHSVVAPHYDLSDNIACVVSGTRRFTLFPPDQISNLYVGPIDITPAGQPTSLVNINNPDLVKFPNFIHALEASQTALLEPGDAIYIPSLWWHGIEALGKINTLVNYWWTPEDAYEGNPFECLVHALMTIRNLPQERRDAWAAFFNYYIFNASDTTHAHIPSNALGALGPNSPELARYIKKFLYAAMNK